MLSKLALRLRREGVRRRLSAHMPRRWPPATPPSPAITPETSTARAPLQDGAWSYAPLAGKALAGVHGTLLWCRTNALLCQEPEGLLARISELARNNGPQNQSAYALRAE